MGEIIDMQQYRMRKTAQRFLESKGAKIGTAANLLREKRTREGRTLHEVPEEELPASIHRHPAGRGRHE